MSTQIITLSTLIKYVHTNHQIVHTHHKIKYVHLPSSLWAIGSDEVGLIGNINGVRSRWKRRKHFVILKLLLRCLNVAPGGLKITFVPWLKMLLAGFEMIYNYTMSTVAPWHCSGKLMATCTNGYRMDKMHKFGTSHFCSIALYYISLLSGM